MAVAEGRDGKITIIASTGGGDDTIAEMGEWSISGISRNMIDFTAFSDETMKHKPGMLDPGTISFSGWFDPTDSTGQQAVIALLSSGTLIGSGTSIGVTYHKLRLWPSTLGYFEVPEGSTVNRYNGIYITGMESGTNKDGLCSISFSGKITGAAIAYTTVP